MEEGRKDMNLQVGISDKQILRIALPISASIIVPQINFITNNIFLGGLSQHALAMAGITGVYYLVFAVMGHGLNNGLQALIARRAGENRIDAIGTLFWQGVRIALAFALAGILITWFVAPWILRYTLHDQSGVDMAVKFLNIRILGLPFLFVYQMRNALLVGTNHSRYLVIGTATEAITNIVLDYGLIYGKLGMPELGFNGAAWASVIAEITGLAVIFLVIHYKGIGKKLELFKNKAYDAAAGKLILTQSSPLILQHTISIVSWEFFYILIEHHGQRDLAVSNTMRNIFGFFGCFTWAFAATANAMVSNVIGQGLHHRVIELIHRIMRWSVGFALIVCVLLNIFPHAFLSIYGQGEDFINAAIPVMRVVSCALVLMSVSVIWLNAVTGTGNSRMNLITETAAIICYCVYNYIVLEQLKLPIAWGWASEVIYWLVLFIPSYWYIRSGRWKSRKI
ncbi:MATE family efflux transporter [Sediminibacterium ginsengisoli]|uniref:Multidrug-efflux transporter n=1 Tax=Sediminibacterium ginsengisoli TaxID=413434 RepID=A0A1T4PR91_9BACT|nr:MATE family efflux transporter [Sediminibacterium ginsengisoli]SJZ94154.1 putative efflux protein, MATE family [Sediminibacterium ginsengisoli]